MDLKARLDWGEPALTIVDVRDRNDFNQSHILGAIGVPEAEMLERLDNLEAERHLYIYSYDDEKTKLAADKLRSAGFESVAELTGGLPAWQACGYASEGIL